MPDNGLFLDMMDTIKKQKESLFVLPNPQNNVSLKEANRGAPPHLLT